MPKITKAGFDSALTVVAAVASAVLPILVAAGDISANHAAAIGAGLAALLAGYHGGATVQTRAATNSPSGVVTIGKGKAETITPDGDPALAVE